MTNLAPILPPPNPHLPTDRVSEVRLRALGRATNLVAPRDSFIGRNSERDIVLELVRSHTSFTVVGSAGVGKTRLVVETLTDALDELLQQFPGGVYRCDVAGAASIAESCATIAVALGLERAIESSTALVEHLAGRPATLLVLDNVENHLDRTRALIEMCQLPQITWIATARQPLRNAGERCVRLSPLSLPDDDNDRDSDAVRLFVERAREVRHDFALRADDARHVCAIARELDGLPNEIELAALRVRSLGAAQIHQLMPHRFKLLTRGTGAGRQDSLRVTVAAQVERLSPSAREALGKLAQFEGDFSLEEATGPDSPWEMIDAIESLCDQSLLTANPVGAKTRYRLLRSVRVFSLDGSPTAPSPPDTKAGALGVAASGRRFHTPAGKDVDLTTRRAMRLLLKALADHRDDAPNCALTLQQLVDAGWPGERTMPEAAAGRVYTSVATLRRMGLRKLLIRRDDGYLLDPNTPLYRLPE